MSGEKKRRRDHELLMFAVSSVKAQVVQQYDFKIRRGDTASKV